MLMRHLLQLLVAVAGAHLPGLHQEAGAQGELVEHSTQKLVGAALLLLVLVLEVGRQKLVDGLDERFWAKGWSAGVSPPPCHVHQGLIQVLLTFTSGDRFVQVKVHIGLAKEEEGGHNKTAAAQVHHCAQAPEDSGRLQRDGRVSPASSSRGLLQCSPLD